MSRSLSRMITLECLTEVQEEGKDKTNDKEREKLLDAALNKFSFGKKLSEAQINELKQRLLFPYSDIVSVDDFDVGKTSLIEHEIVTGDAAPRKRNPYRLSPVEQERVEELIKQLREKGIIRESCSPWSAPIVIVKKKDGSLRFCCDWRDLNAVTRKDNYPLPRIDATLDRLGGMKYFSSLDFTQGYYQIPMKADSIPKTAFVVPNGQYEFTVAGMGLTGAPATFQRLMNRMLGSLIYTNCLAYLDDVIIFSETFEQHVADIEQVFDRIRAAGLKIKPSKCTLATDSMKFLGHIISADGLQCDPDKVEKVKSWPQPRTRTHAKSFLGLASYYRRFIDNFSRVAFPLTQLTRESVPFEWTKATNDAFESLKHSLITAPVLALPDFTKPFIVSTDASDHGLGAILKQTDAENRERVIAYASRSLTPAEKNYTTSERECLALIFATKIFRPYLFGTEFVCYTDHAALLWLDNVKNPNGRLARWSLYLRDFRYTIKYKKGKLHSDADALSRRGNDEILQISDSQTGPDLSSDKLPASHVRVDSGGRVGGTRKSEEKSNTHAREKEMNERPERNSQRTEKHACGNAELVMDVFEVSSVEDSALRNARGYAELVTDVFEVSSVEDSALRNARGYAELVPDVFEVSSVEDSALRNARGYAELVTDVFEVSSVEASALRNARGNAELVPDVFEVSSVEDSALKDRELSKNEMTEMNAMNETNETNERVKESSISKDGFVKFRQFLFTPHSLPTIR